MPDLLILLNEVKFSTVIILESVISNEAIFSIEAEEMSKWYFRASFCNVTVFKKNIVPFPLKYTYEGLAKILHSSRMTLFTSFSSAQFSIKESKYPLFLRMRKILFCILIPKTWNLLIQK